ncbi:ABC transporter permease subunit [Isoptericola halotolerans]|uniref:Peptide/nickel transport system permease protein n=1 Tax=Isoptericola halotolerans TaxID=300560 RepID=A0ABX2A735_9MICO|nr:ABC transporter permease subunit [Isoptericola halotolerans]NOV98682.1 peptide/nickel transport system permease protein [Isoptericola halotolerans]
MSTRRRTARPRLAVPVPLGRRTRRAAGGLGLAVLLAVALLALLGPLWPGSPTAQVGLPYTAPGVDGRLLGTDGIGRDVALRVLHGGARLVLVAAGATVIGVVAAVLLGVLPALLFPRAGGVVMRGVDALGVMPGLLVLLLLAAAFPGDDLVLMVGVAVVSVPYSTRVLRAVARQISGAGYVEVARARGDRWWTVMLHDVLPNLAPPVAAETGLRFTTALHLSATAGFLGLGRGAPWPDWGLMVQENLPGISLNPWAVVVPSALLVLLIVGVTVVADRAAARLGRVTA